MAKFGLVNTSGLTAWMEYNPSNLRVSQVGFDNAGPRSFGWEVKINQNSFTGIIAPNSAGLQNVGGNFRLVEKTVIDPEEGDYTTVALPDGVSYKVWTI